MSFYNFFNDCLSLLLPNYFKHFFVFVSNGYVSVLIYFLSSFVFFSNAYGFLSNYYLFLSKSFLFLSISSVCYSKFRLFYSTYGQFFSIYIGFFFKDCRPQSYYVGFFLNCVSFVENFSLYYVLTVFNGSLFFSNAFEPY